MVFVVGARRSGTNWLQRILAAHPDAVSAPAESNLFSSGLSPLQDRFQHGAVRAPAVGRLYMDRDRFLDALRDFCDAAFGGLLEVLAPDALYLVERSPMDSNVVDLIGAVYPDATVVHIIRDGRDVARSLVSQEWGPTSMAEAADEWRQAVESARKAGAALDRYHEVRYEELLADVVQGVPALYEAIGFDTSDDAVATALVEAGISYNADPRSPTLAAGKWRESFSAEDLDTFVAVAGPTLAELGYDKPPMAKPSASAPSAAAPPPRIRRRPPVKSAVRRLVGRGRVPSTPNSSFSAEVLERLRSASEVLDAVLADLALRRFEALAGRLAGPAPVQILGAGPDWRERGDAGRERLIAELTDDSALRGRQVRGDVYSAIPLHTLIASYVTDEGQYHDRILVVGIEGDTLTTLTWYRFEPRQG
ncbi:MAG: hypothetical protein QOC92_2245 [Acidimicrobiaceae bacterium]|jgi:hypothetical protein